MPTYPLTFPSAPIPQKIVVRRNTVVARFDNPFTLQSQVQLLPGARWELDITLQKMDVVDVAAWTQFFYDLQGSFGTFTFDLTPHVAGLSPDPGSVAFRLAKNDISWNEELATIYDFSFSAIQAL